MLDGRQGMERKLFLRFSPMELPFFVGKILVFKYSSYTNTGRYRRSKKESNSDKQTFNTFTSNIHKIN